MKGGTKIALGVAGGYVLGRFRKTRWLALLAAGLATKKAADELGQRGATSIGSSPELSKLAEQGREAAAAILGSRIEGLTERIHARTESLRETAGAGEEEGEEPEGSEARAEDGEEEEPEARAEDEEEEEPEAGAEEEEEEPEARAEEEEQEEEPEARTRQQPKQERGRGEAPGARRPESRRRATEPRASRPRGGTASRRNSSGRRQG